MRGNYQEAIELYSKAIELNDQNAIYFSNRRLIDRVWPQDFFLNGGKGCLNLSSLF